MAPINLPDHYSGLELDFHTLANHIPQLAWMAQPDGYVFWYNQPWLKYTGLSVEEAKGSGWLAVQHPDHVERVKSAYSKSLRFGVGLEETLLLRRHDGEWRWFLTQTRPICDHSGAIIRWFGTQTDITEQKNVEERQKRLMREIDHRAKNALAVAQAVVKLSRGDSIAEYREVVESRIAALTRAHGLLAESLWNSADIREILNGELNARRDRKGTVDLSGESVRVDPGLGQPLALVFNELITNAERYGALAYDSGRLSVEWGHDQSNIIAIQWIETGVPLEQLKPEKQGFGSTVLERMVCQQMRGSFEREWTPDGVHYAIHFPPQTAQAY